MKKLFIASVFIGSLALMAFQAPKADLLKTNQINTNDPCGCTADLIECLTNNNGPCFAEYKWCIRNCG
jgi:hypothetical protein